MPATMVAQTGDDVEILREAPTFTFGNGQRKTALSTVNILMVLAGKHKKFLAQDTRSRRVKAQAQNAAGQQAQAPVISALWQVVNTLHTKELDEAGL